MNKMNRAMNTGEKILMIIFALLVIGGVYYYFVYSPVQKDLVNQRSRREELSVELRNLQAQVKDMRDMKTELEELEGAQDSPRMESYNNSRAEIGLLNDILTASEEYTIDFSSVSRDGNQIRRSFSLRFTTDSFDTAEQIIKSLRDSRCRCLIDDVSYKAATVKVVKQTNEDGEEEEVNEVGTVSVSLIATFYETMVGGTEDAGLPEDGKTIRG
ncbi:MAG: hypothetical protein E7425_00835 [Ruminococcaceae bacterium]|jgi:hypothetical protein|nr:hypothetical protein [Oscillospiraceae bacterium]